MGERQLDAKIARYEAERELRESSSRSGASESETSAAQELLDSGAISQEEFERLRDRARG